MTEETDRSALFSNIGGTAITQLAHDKQVSGIARENYDILEFQQLLSDVSNREAGMILPRVSLLSS